MAEVLRGATPPTWRTSMYYRYELRSVHDDPAYVDDLTGLQRALARLVDELGDNLELPSLR